jgi:hypothetical protein
MYFFYQDGFAQGDFSFQPDDCQIVFGYHGRWQPALRPNLCSSECGLEPSNWPLVTSLLGLRHLTVLQMMQSAAGAHFVSHPVASLNCSFDQSMVEHFLLCKWAISEPII